MQSCRRLVVFTCRFSLLSVHDTAVKTPQVNRGCLPHFISTLFYLPPAFMIVADLSTIGECCSMACCLTHFRVVRHDAFPFAVPNMLESCDRIDSFRVEVVSDNIDRPQRLLPIFGARGSFKFLADRSVGATPDFCLPKVLRWLCE